MSEQKRKRTGIPAIASEITSAPQAMLSRTAGDPDPASLYEAGFFDMEDVVLEEACRQWCDGIPDAPERSTGEGFAAFYQELREQLLHDANFVQEVQAYLASQRESTQNQNELGGIS